VKSRYILVEIVSAFLMFSVAYTYELHVLHISEMRETKGLVKYVWEIVSIQGHTYIIYLQSASL